jgi:hypothetical protein
MNKPRITLLSVTQDIPGVMGRVWQIAKGKETLSDMEKILLPDADDVLSADLPVAEYVNFIWCV